MSAIIAPAPLLSDWESSGFPEGTLGRSIYDFSKLDHPPPI